MDLKERKKFAVFSDITNTFYFCSLKVVQKGACTVSTDWNFPNVLSLSDSTFKPSEKLLKALRCLYFFPI